MMANVLVASTLITCTASTGNSSTTTESPLNVVTAPADCSICIFQGNELVPSYYTSYPEGAPGKYKDFPMVSKYGTMCAAWEMIQGTPLYEECKGKDYSQKEYNYCQMPWCYVDPACDHAIPSDVFKGSRASAYSYKICGNATDCRKDAFDKNACPYDPNKDKSYAVHKKSCECKYSGSSLPTDLVKNFPEEDKGKYANLPGIGTYGSVCAAWDQSKNTPYFPYCNSQSPEGELAVNWCTPKYNWCQVPWCYVDKDCESAIASSVFKGSPAAFYSYDTCLSSPDCYKHSGNPEMWGYLDDACPFDDTDNGWATATPCMKGWDQPNRSVIEALKEKTTTLKPAGTSDDSGSTDLASRKSESGTLVLASVFFGAIVWAM